MALEGKEGGGGGGGRRKKTDIEGEDVTKEAERSPPGRNIEFEAGGEKTTL